jgi:predicted nucleic acid-binding protein
MCIWPHALDGDHPGLAARDLVHLACCRRRGVTKAITFDRALGSVLG